MIYTQLFLFFISHFFNFSRLLAQNTSPPSPRNPANDYMFPIQPDVSGPQAQSVDRFFSEFLNMLVTLSLIIILILIAAWFLKRMLNTRMQQVNSTSPIKILERRALTPKTAVYLLDIHGKGFVIADSQNGVTNLGEISLDAVASVAEDDQSAFRKVYEDNKRKE